MEADKPWAEQTPQRVPNPPDQSDVFRGLLPGHPMVASSEAGSISPTQNEGILLYTFETNAFRADH